MFFVFNQVWFLAIVLLSSYSLALFFYPDILSCSRLSEVEEERFVCLKNSKKNFIFLFSIAVVKIVHFTVVCLVAKPLNGSEAYKVDLVMIQTSLLFKCKLLCYHAN